MIKHYYLSYDHQSSIDSINIFASMQEASKCYQGKIVAI